VAWQWITEPASPGADHDLGRLKGDKYVFTYSATQPRFSSLDNSMGQPKDRWTILSDNLDA